MRLGPAVGRRASQPGRILLPPVEIVELVDGAPVGHEPAKLRERRGWLARFVSRNRASRFVVSAETAPEIFSWREDFALVEIDATGRPVLHVLPGMTGELRIGVSHMSVAQMLADPALAGGTLGGARIPVPYGARIHIGCGHRNFVVRVGGPPLMSTPQLSPGMGDQGASSSSLAQFAHA